MRYILLLFTACLFFATPLQAALSAPLPAEQTERYAGADLSREAVEAQIGRKLKFTERIALSIVRTKAKKKARKLAKNGPDGTVVDGLSLASMILGILAFVGIIAGFFPYYLAIAALVLGIVGLGRVNREQGYLRGKGYAIAGIALGGTWLFLAILAVGLLILAFNN